MSAVVNKGVHSLLKHTLFVSDNYIGGFKLLHSFKTVVSVDNPSVQIVKVGGGKSAAVQQHHRTDIGGDYGDYVHNHPLGTVSALSEGFHYVKSFQQL